MSAPAKPIVDRKSHEHSVLSPEEWPSFDHFVTEDDTPVDNVYSEKQQRLLVEPLYTSWPGPGNERPFLAMANVGLFYGLNFPSIVPDALLSLDVKMVEDPFPKRNRSYFTWVYGKAPEAVLEVVSNTVGEELDYKKEVYARVGVLYYAVWDPEEFLKQGKLNLFVLRDKAYAPLAEPWFPVIGLGLTVWHGVFEDLETDWLRWCDRPGQVILTGCERIALERQRAEQEHQRAEKLAAQLRALGIEPQP